MRKFKSSSSQVFFKNRYSSKCRNIQRKIVILESLFNKVPGLKALMALLLKIHIN